MLLIRVFKICHIFGNLSIIEILITAYEGSSRKFDRFRRFFFFPPSFLQKGLAPNREKRSQNLCFSSPLQPSVFNLSKVATLWLKETLSAFCVTMNLVYEKRREKKRPQRTRTHFDATADVVFIILMVSRTIKTLKRQFFGTVYVGQGGITNTDENSHFWSIDQKKKDDASEKKFWFWAPYFNSTKLLSSRNSNCVLQSLRKEMTFVSVG